MSYPTSGRMRGARCWCDFYHIIDFLHKPRYFGAFIGDFVMARSKAARRRRSRGAVDIPYGKMRGSHQGNWIIGGTAVDNAGLALGGFLGTWSPTAAFPTTGIVNTGSVTYQAVVIPAGINVAAPTVGRVRVDELKGRLLFQPYATVANYRVAVAIYISEFTINTSAFDVINPINPADGARDEYFFLEAREFDLCTPLTHTSPYAEAHMDIKLSEPVYVSGGQALHITVAQANNAAAALCCFPAFRVRVSSIT